jgi:hypothetical protein
VTVGLFGLKFSSSIQSALSLSARKLAEENVLNQEMQTSLESKIINVSQAICHVVSVPNAQLCCYSIETVTSNIQMKG